MIPAEKAMRAALREFLKTFCQEHRVNHYEACVLAQEALHTLTKPLQRAIPEHAAEDTVPCAPDMRPKSKK